MKSRECRHAVIPQPAQVERSPGLFTLDADTILVADAKAERTAHYLAETLYPATGFRLRVQTGMAQPPPNSIVLDVNPGCLECGGEGYEAAIRPEGVRIEAFDSAGLFYACQTLRQLLPKEILRASKPAARAWTVPCMTIRDKPRFPWRGLMLDVARYFLTKEFILRCIDLLALYKMNRLHLHLNDAQSWTLEITDYPRLTDPKTRTSGPGLARGTYTRKDMRDIVDYAAARHVMVVPEIDFPAHSCAALNAYPELACAHLPRAAQGPQGFWEFCAGREGVYDFIDAVISDVAGIFDAPFIHIGGDEYGGVSWVDCPDCRRRIETEALEAEDTPELQELFRRCQGSPRKYLLYRYMMRRVARIVAAKNRIPILWDDLAWRGKFPERTVVMQWHYPGCNDWAHNARIVENPATEAARAGHDVVAAPASHLYFDYLDGGALLQRLYDFEPVPQNLTEKEIPHVLGPHACLWEHPQEKVDEMLFPRLLILAEQGWTAKPARQWNLFARRLKKHYPRLDILGVRYTKPPKTDGLSQGTLSREWDIPKLTTCKKDWLINGVVTGNGCYELTLRLHAGKETTSMAVSWFDDGCSPVILSDCRPAEEAPSGEHSYRMIVSEFLPQALYYIRLRLSGDGKSDCRGEMVLKKKEPFIKGNVKNDIQ